MTEAADDSVQELADFLTLEEAARVLRIGRNTAYELARQYVCTDGAKGLPVVRVGRALRVPRALLEAWHGGPLTLKPSSRRRRPAKSVVRHLKLVAGE